MHHLTKRNFEEFLDHCRDELNLDLACAKVKEGITALTLYYNENVKDEHGHPQHIATWHSKANFLMEPFKKQLKEKGFSDSEVCFTAFNHNFTSLGSFPSKGRAQIEAHSYTQATGNWSCSECTPKQEARA